MRLHVFSDIHLEFGNSPVKATDAEVVVAAGDIGPGLAGAVWLKKTFQAPVIYVPGNHEYYNRVMERFDEELDQKCGGTNICFGRHPGRRFDIAGVRFLATTLWTDFALYGDPVSAMSAAKREMTDYRQIRVTSPLKRFSGMPMKPEYALERHQEAVVWLRQELAKPWEGKTVVVSHHAPTAATSSGLEDSPGSLDPCYASNLDDLLDGWDATRPAVDLAVHGHIHTRGDVMARRTRVVVNARGYARYRLLVKEFDPQLIVEV